MLKATLNSEDITQMDIYAPSNTMTTFMKQKVQDIPGHRERH